MTTTRKPQFAEEDPWSRVESSKFRPMFAGVKVSFHLHPFIYSKGLKLYKDVAKKNTLWESKVLELGLQVSHLKQWYDNIRTKIGKMYRKKSGAPAREYTERVTFVRQNFGFPLDHFARSVVEPHAM